MTETAFAGLMEPVTPAIPSTSDSPVPPRRSRLKRLIRRLYRLVVGLLAAGMLVLILLVTTPVPESVYDWLAVTQKAEPADFIACLGGDYERLVWTARAFNQKLAPRVIVSNAPGAAEFMRDVLVHCGVPRDDILVDSQSHTTFEHPAGLARLPGVDPARSRFLFITSHVHSRRAAAVFRKAGYAHVIMCSGPRVSFKDDRVSRFKWRVMNLASIGYECAALLQYWLQGRI